MIRKVAGHTARKWWYRWIRAINWFSFRYYWFVWILFLGGLGLIFFCLQKPLESKNCNSGIIDQSIINIHKNLDSCCACKEDTVSTPTPTPPEEDTTVTEPPHNPPRNAKQCNSIVNSGSQGVDTKLMELGEESGVVTLEFYPENVPDKIEVFYEGRKIITSYDCNNNQNGFVGGNIGSSTCFLRFNYRFHRDSFVKVIVTAPGNLTSWQYKISCPQ